MRLHKGSMAPHGFALLLISCLLGEASGYVQKLCSSQNTGAGTDDHAYQYNSDGACVHACQGYAFGIVQYDKCWCSNTAPGDTVDLSNCSKTCPGYPFELCGNLDAGLFGYIDLGKAPQSTAADGGGGGGSAPSSSPAPSPSSSPSPSPSPSPTPEVDTVTKVVTSVAVSIQSPAPELSVSVSSVIVVGDLRSSRAHCASYPEDAAVSAVPRSLPSTERPSAVVLLGQWLLRPELASHAGCFWRTTANAPQTQSSPKPSTITRAASPTFTPTPSPSFLTIGGSVQTIVVTPTDIPPQATTTIAVSDQQPATNTNNGFFTNKGAVAGVFTVVALLIVAIIAALLFFFWRKKTHDSEGSERLNSMEEDRNSIVPSTFMSRRTSELGLRTDLPRVGTSDEKTPTSMGMAGNGTTSRRASLPLTDQRLNPAHLFHDNGSHLSVASLQDNRDYSRPVLQVANPDRPGSSAIMDD